MLTKTSKIFLIAFVIVVLFNLAFLDYFLFLKGKTAYNWESTELLNSKLPLQENAADSCGSVCQETIFKKIEEELGKLPTPAGESSVTPTKPKVVVQPSQAQPKIAYVPLASEGSATSVDWKDIPASEFYFDLADFPGVKEVRFQTYLLSSNNDQVSARLYDATNKRGIDFSDLQTSSSTFTRLESSQMKIWRGNNKYTVQLRSVNGTLAQLKDAKLKIIY